MLCLCGCQKSEEQILAELGYTEENIQTILALSDENKERFSMEFDEKLINLVSDSRFIEEKIEDYLHFEGKLDTDLMFDLVNRNMLTDTNLKKMVELYTSPYFVSRNEDLYLNSLDDYSTVREMMEIINTKRYLPLYENIVTTDVKDDYLLLVNKYYQLPSDYEPEDLVYITGAYRPVQIREEVASHYEKLLSDALANGYDLRVVSAYRSYSYQDGLYNKYLLSDTKENVDTYSARPGHSEHQSGLCLDVTIPGYSIDDFYKTEASKWLAENCYKYGFIIRYENGKENITGYQAEPWQIRYVGDKAAKEIKDMKITFDEYWECFVRN